MREEETPLPTHTTITSCQLFLLFISGSLHVVSCCGDVCGWSTDPESEWEPNLGWQVDLEKLLSEWPQHLVASWPRCEPFGFISKRPFVFYGVPARPVSCCVFAVPNPPECGRTTNPNSGYKLQTCLWRRSVCSPLGELHQQTPLFPLVGAQNNMTPTSPCPLCPLDDFSVFTLLSSV